MLLTTGLSMLAAVAASPLPKALANPSLPAPPKAGIYASCIARGMALFGEPGIETKLIRETLGDFPLIGFFANG